MFIFFLIVSLRGRWTCDLTTFQINKFALIIINSVKGTTQIQPFRRSQHKKQSVFVSNEGKKKSLKKIQVFHFLVKNCYTARFIWKVLKAISPVLEQSRRTEFVDPKIQTVVQQWVVRRSGMSSCLCLKLAVAGRSRVLVSAFVLFFSDELNIWSPWTLALGDFKVSVRFFFLFFSCWLQSISTASSARWLRVFVFGHFWVIAPSSSATSLTCYTSSRHLLGMLSEIPPTFRKRTSDNARMCSFYSLHVEALIAPLFVVWHDRISHWFLF